MFPFRLCLALGVRHPDYLLPTLTAQQMADWEAVFPNLPFGQDHTDYLLATLCALIEGRKSRPAKFLPFADDTISQEELSVRLSSIPGVNPVK